MTIHGGSHEGERGQALVEFALTIPLVFLLIFSVIDFARLLYAFDLVTGAARVVSRYAMVHGPACTAVPGCAATATQIQTYVRTTMSGVDSSTVTVATTWPPAGGCAGGTPVQGCPVLVQVTYPFQFAIVSSLTIPIVNSSQLVVTR